MKLAVIGSGGREHAILWKLAHESDSARLYALPGNGGTATVAENVPVHAENVNSLRQAILTINPDLVIVGPEVPLAGGIVDRLTKDNIPCFGPSAGAARIEASKVFAKELMQEYGVPTADFRIFSDFETLRAYVTQTPEENGWVVKADGLAAGKGAFVCSSQDEVLNVAHSLLSAGALGEAGKRVILERKLAGREASALFWCDGEHFLPLPLAQDYKRVGGGDTGPNTGGMGCFCPTPALTPNLRLQVEELVVKPVLNALRDMGCPFKGILYVGLMMTVDGPQVIEFNCRFGDPETQVILPCWPGELVKTMHHCINGTLDQMPRPAETTRHAVCVVLAAEGYPGMYLKGIPLQSVPDGESAVTFHAGTTAQSGNLVSSGGRVLNAVGFAPDLSTARLNAYRLAEQLTVPGLFCRKDIALDI